MNRPVTRYAMSGDLHIAYQTFGEGPFDLVYAPGFISHVEMNWELPYWANIFRRLSQFCRVIVFDKRGTGLSDRVGGWPTLDERMDDIRAVMDAAESERAALLGVSEGGPMCMAFAAIYPERASALVLRGTGPRFAAGPDWPWGWTEEAVAPQLDLVEQNWGTGTVLPFFIMGVSDDERAQEDTGRFERFAASPGAARQLLEMNLQVDIRSVLSSISAPTLVIHRSGDYVAPVEAGRYTAEHISNATFVELPGDFRLSARPGDEDEAMDVIEQFLTGTRGDHEIDRVLATVLFSDIVGSTERASTLGDQAWRTLLDRHDKLARREIGRFGGREIKSLGDGFFAAFDGRVGLSAAPEPSPKKRTGSASRSAVDSTQESVRYGTMTWPGSQFTSGRGLEGSRSLVRSSFPRPLRTS